MKRTIHQNITTAQAFKQGFVGLEVYDLEKEKTLYEFNSNKNFIPASNIKLLTFYTGLKVLGDSVPGIKYSIKRDSLFFWGTGDPTFLHKDFQSTAIWEFLNSREEKLFFVPYTEVPSFGPGWAWDDYNSYYSAERSSFPIYGNLVTFHFLPNEQGPKVFPGIFQDSVENAGGEGYSRATRAISSNKFRYTYFSENRKRVQEVPLKYSPKTFVRLLSDTLGKKVEIMGSPPQDLGPVKKLFSTPIDSLYKKMLWESDNFIAEQILLLAAGELSDTLRPSIAIDEMKKRYLKDLPDEPKWVDGSGLSRYNLMTPRSLVKLLEKISKKVPMDKLLEFLPAGGKSGTLKSSYRSEEPYVFAKTGSLSNHHSLSGFLRTKKGRYLIFSFMNSNFITPAAQVKLEMEKILYNIYLTY